MASEYIKNEESNSNQTTVILNPNLKDFAITNLDLINVNNLYYLDKSLNYITVLVSELLNDNNYYI